MPTPDPEDAVLRLYEGLCDEPLVCAHGDHEVYPADLRALLSRLDALAQENARLATSITQIREDVAIGTRVMEGKYATVLDAASRTTGEP